MRTIACAALVLAVGLAGPSEAKTRRHHGRSGHRIHMPVQVVKGVDTASPAMWQSLAAGQHGAATNALRVSHLPPPAGH